ncbi:Heterokaryon incompatibility protein (HET) domain containing protein [Hyaloscypha variabilis]
MMTSTPPKSYQYEELQGEQTTRMLVLNPAAERDSSLQCSPIPIRLSEMKEVVALSYAWGEPLFTERLCIFRDDREDSYLEISPNLSNILRWLRDASSVQKIWVDAVCINQSNSNEKNNQVTEMWKIYSLASKVKIWLGESDIGLEQLFIDMHGKDPEGCCSTVIGPHYSTIDKNRLVQLLKHPWFTRRWIVQEAMLAHSLEFVCQDSVIDFSIFSGAVYYVKNDILYGSGCEEGLSTLLCIRETRLRRKYTELNPAELPNIVSGGLGRKLQRNLRQKIRSPQKTASLKVLKIIGGVPHTKCREDEDRVYALIGAVNWGFSSYGEEANNKLASFFPFSIDYGEGSATTYLRFSLALIQVGRQTALEMLRFTSALPHTKNMLDKLPSWVPDWSQRVVPECFTSWKNKPFSAGGDACLKVDMTSLDTDNITSGRTKPAKSPHRRIRGQIRQANTRTACVDISVPFDRSILISGAEVDTVRLSLPPINSNDIKMKWPEQEALWSSLQTWWLLACKNRAISDPSSRRGLGALLYAFETAIYYHFVDHSRGPVLFTTHIGAIFEKLGIFHTSSSSEDQQVYSLQQTEGKLSIRLYFLLLGTLEGLLTQLRGAEFLVTDNGRVGFCCGSPRPGDKVAIFFGAKMPFVVRSETRQGKECIKLIGESYISGIMQGEVVKEARKAIFCVI